MSRPFRFGVNLRQPAGAEEWAQQCRRAGQLGYDVILVPDHLDTVAPFPALVAAAQAAPDLRVGTFVLNTGFWNPALLARETATTDTLTGGRLELGLGTGYAQTEHHQAGLDFLPARNRVDALQHTVEQLDRLLTDPGHRPQAAQTPRPPLLIGGNGNRLLRLMAERADIAAFTASSSYTNGTLHALTADQFAERIAVFEKFAADRAVPAERNLLVHHVEVTTDRRATARRLPKLPPQMPENERLTLPVMLYGTVRQIAEQLRTQRERFGISYIVILDHAMDTFAPVIEELADT